jgi:hypothetical protein
VAPRKSGNPNGMEPILAIVDQVNASGAALSFWWL